MSTLTPVGNFADIRYLLGQLPGIDEAAAEAARRRQSELLKPEGSLGRLEDLAAWLAGWQGRHPPKVERIGIFVFAGNHGVTKHGISAYPAAVTRQMVESFDAGRAAINQLARLVGAELQVIPLRLDEPTADLTRRPAMSEADCVDAFNRGLTAPDDDLDVIALGEMGIGNTTVAAALSMALFGGEAEAWAGPGTGLDAQGVQRKAATLRKALTRHEAVTGDPLEVLRSLGGFEVAAIIGAILAGRLRRTPVVLDGYVSTAAAAVLAKLEPGSLDHCVAGHLSAEPGHRKLLGELGMRPLLELQMRLGEASGATLALSIIRAAAACHADMATFAEAGVEGPTPRGD